MRVIVFRHGIAHDSKPDTARSLTTEGARKIQRGARGLKAIQPRLSLIATSPLARAKQTAAILAGRFNVRVETWPELSLSGTPQEIWARVARHPAMPAIALVGHEPRLSALASWLVSGETQSFIALKKGGACCVDFAQDLKPTQGTLRWVLTPRQLRALGT